MSEGAFDRRGCSFAADVDAAIERVVRDLEGRDVALRLDALRALSAHARLAFETARARERLGQHPVAMDLITGVTSPSPVYKTVAETLTVESCSCVYDGRRDVVMTTSVGWPPRRSRASVKKRKQTAGTCATDGTKKMYTNYRFERTRRREAEEERDGVDGAEWSLVKFSLVVAFGDDDPSPRELLYFELACEHSYPKSHYEDQHGSVLLSRKGEEEEGEDERVDGDEASKRKEKKAEGKEDDEQVVQKSNVRAVDEAKGDDDETFGEEQRDFRFDNGVLADMAEWMRPSGEDDELDPVDVVGFFLALPVYEDEWLIDERVCAILFSDGTEGDGRDDSGSETEEEIADGASKSMRR
ncbi:unnamed protein product [Hyaloperonospora brassicae]|uniref:Uncharacterized protein n=1 Tax=Hyaloperonospora brassicae TaxID=162125 RepID=A0AAV0TAU1_HYABA|nr:unnamed protein product [Hyaloperonospora brassicae]